MAQVTEAHLNKAFLDLAPLVLDLAKAFSITAGWLAKVTDGFRELEDRSSVGLKEQLAKINEELARPADPNMDSLGLLGVAEDPAAAGAYRRSLEARRREIEAILKAREEAAELAAKTGGVGLGGGTAAMEPAPLRQCRAKARPRRNAKVLADLNRQLETFGDERQQAIDRALARVSDGATAQTRADVERLAGSALRPGRGRAGRRQEPGRRWPRRRRRPPRKAAPGTRARPAR